MRRAMLLAGLLGMIFWGCSKNSFFYTGKGTATFNVYLTDAPGSYEEVLIDIRQVRVHVDEGDSTSGWRELESVKAGVYNLLDFTNHMDTLLASEELPAGHISQMRLVLGDSNRVKVNGVYHDLKTPSGQQSGLKLNIHADLQEDIDYDIWIDFDACRSIVRTGNGKYILKPVIRTYTKATTGAISGVVDPIEAYPYIMAVSENKDTVGTLADSTSGDFLLKGLAEGNYDVIFEPDSGYMKKTIEDVLVVTGEVTELDTVVIEQVR